MLFIIYGVYVWYNCYIVVSECKLSIIKDFITEKRFANLQKKFESTGTVVKGTGKVLEALKILNL